MIRNCILLALLAVALPDGYGKEEGLPHEQLRDDSCPSHPHIITHMPYWASDQSIPCMYAGTFKVNPFKDHYLFYWFFRNQDDNKPLILWLNGGPGASSMFGLLYENGPLRPNNDTGEWKVTPAEKSWFTQGSLIYVDNPVNTGFSYGDTYVDNMEEIAAELVNLLHAFFSEYQEFIGREFMITGESYAGKYNPALAKAIVDYNEKDPRAKDIPINLTTVMMGDPYTLPVKERTEIHNIPYSLGLIEDQHMSQMGWLEQQCEVARAENWPDAGDICGNCIDFVDRISGGVYHYDARYFGYDYKKNTSYAGNFLSDCPRKKELYNVLNVGWLPKDPIFSNGTQAGKVAEALEGD